MKWREVNKGKPNFGELIWVWDTINNHKFLIRYHGNEEIYDDEKRNYRFPIWAKLNED